MNKPESAASPAILAPEQEPETTRTVPAVAPSVRRTHARFSDGVQRLARGDTSGAISSLRAAITDDPNHASSWQALSLVHDKCGDSGRAREAFRRYLELAPSAAGARAIRRRLEGLGS